MDAVGSGRCVPEADPVDLDAGIREFAHAEPRVEPTPAEGSGGLRASVAVTPDNFEDALRRWSMDGKVSLNFILPFCCYFCYFLTRFNGCRHEPAAKRGL